MLEWIKKENDAGRMESCNVQNLFDLHVHTYGRTGWKARTGRLSRKTGLNDIKKAKQVAVQTAIPLLDAALLDLREELDALKERCKTDVR